jgi:anti-sigma factor RsiW
VNGRNSPVTDNDLHAFADGLLPPSKRAEVDTHLAETPADAERVAAYRRLNENLHAAFDGELDRPVPEEWTRRPPRGAAQIWRDWRTTRAAAGIAALILIGIGAGGGWYARGLNAPTPTQAASRAPIVYYAARAHDVYAQENRHAVEVAADQEEHLVRWLSTRMGAPVRAPKLNDVGYKLMGGRLLPSGVTLAAQFMYEDSAGARLTLYVKSGVKAKSEDVEFRYDEDGGVAVFYWAEGPFGYALAGRVARDQLLRVAQSVSMQLDKVPYKKGG